ncbi:MAG: DUF2953 domain-containing protein [Clostridia bacterium]
MTITLLFKSDSTGWSLSLKFLFFKINLSEILEKNIKASAKTSKNKKKKQEKNSESEIISQIREEIKSQNNPNLAKKEEIKKEPEVKKETTEKTGSTKKQEKSEKNSDFQFDFDKIDDYMELLSDVLDILEELAFCLTVEKISTEFFLRTDDDAKTGKLIGVFWVLYGNITAFLYKNFIIKQYKIDITPIWEQTSFEVVVNSEIIVHTSICRVLKNINYKKIKEIRKRDLI